MTQVDLIESDGTTTHTIWTGTDGSQGGAPSDFLISSQQTSYNVK